MTDREKEKFEIMKRNCNPSGARVNNSDLLPLILLIEDILKRLTVLEQRAMDDDNRDRMP